MVQEGISQRHQARRRTLILAKINSNIRFFQFFTHTLDR